jgi:hypothetical protein
MGTRFVHHLINKDSIKMINENEIKILNRFGLPRHSEIYLYYQQLMQNDDCSHL